MTAIYDEVEIEDFTFELETNTYFYPCPCGDRFQITLTELQDGEEIARCPSCSLMLRVIYDEEALRKNLFATGALYDEAMFSPQ